MSTSQRIEFSHYDSVAIESIIFTTVTPVYVESHTDVASDPFYSAERFVDRLYKYMKAPRFELVVGRSLHGSPAGQAFGYALPPDARWWKALTTPIDPDMIAEDGARTFALCELMVLPRWQRHGIAQALHDELLLNRSEERATLLVREDNIAAQRAYEKWGWHQIGRLQAFPDSPHFDVLLLDLRRQPAKGGSTSTV